ncbi:hypothetical protein TRFO_29033 [Tritrichomonas foetus]|uniref:DNA damage-binding protein 1 n=1 Tax=Tritrichomonas foetus TaxID=1144522 RepID=A0A1J4JWL8_9EUKA|nr:hypothetical protein TRFO_29033 [Tritrichomonas foetus]|eukprot:OHT03543.1 hypothetical protein TRFO_29033 [Tritrichomonas foetus]
MKLLHTTITRSQKVLGVLPFGSSDSGVVNVLLIFRNYVQRLQVERNKDNSKFGISSVGVFPLGAPVVWCSSFGDVFAAITSDAHILFFDKEPPFSPKSNHQITDRLSPSQIPIAHISTSINHNFLICTGFTKNCVVIQVKDNVYHQMNIELPNFTVLKIAPTINENIFAFLVMNTEGHKFITFVDIVSPVYQQIREIEVSKDTYLIVAINYGSDILVFDKNSISVLDGKSISSSQISSYFLVDSKYIIYQTIDGYMFGLHIDDEKDLFNPTLLGRIPLMSKFALIEENTLFCISEYGNSYFINFAGIDIKRNFLFEELPKQTLPLTPRIICAIFKGRNLIVASGHGDQSSISQISNSLQLRREHFEHIETCPPMELFCVPADTLIGSSLEKTNVIYGNADISSNPTLTIGRVKNYYLQIHNHGIRNINTGNNWESPDEVVAAAIGDENCFVSLKNGQCLVLDHDFNVLTNKNIGPVYDAAYCEKNIAIATKSAGNDHSAIVIYSLDLNPGDSEAHLPSPVCSTHFCLSTMELYVSTQDGNVYKFEVYSPNFADTKANIYSSKVVSKIYPFAGLILIVAERTFFYNGQQLLALAATDVPPLAVATFDNSTSMYALDQNGDIFLINVEDSERDLTSRTVVSQATPRRVMNYADYTIAISRSVNHGVVSSFLRILKHDEIVSVSLGEKIGAISMLRIPDRQQFILGCQKPNGQDYQYFLNVMNFDSDLPVSIQQIDVPAPPNVMAYYNGIVLVAAGRKIYSLIDHDNKWVLSSSWLASLHTQIGFIEISDNFIWVGDRTQSLICFLINKKEDNSTINMPPIAIDTEPKQLTSVCVIDKYKIAVGDKFGVITILQLPDDVIANFPWRTSQPSERGVFMPPCAGHLIKIASYNVGEAITSLIKSDFSNALFYTTLLGQIGAFIPINNDEDYNHLATAEHLAKQHWQKEFGMMKLKKFEHLNISVVGLDLIELIDQLTDAKHKQIEENLESGQKISIQQMMGILSKYKAMCKF